MSTAITRPADGHSVYEMHLRVRQYEIAHTHVNHAVYLHYIEEATAEHNESLGIGLMALADRGGLFMVKHHDVEYSGAATIGDQLVVATWIESVSGPRLVRGYEIRHTERNRLLVAARTTWVWVDLDANRPRRIPQFVLDRVTPACNTI